MTDTVNLAAEAANAAIIAYKARSLAKSKAANAAIAKARAARAVATGGFRAAAMTEFAAILRRIATRARRNAAIADKAAQAAAARAAAELPKT